MNYNIFKTVMMVSILSASFAQAAQSVDFSQAAKAAAAAGANATTNARKSNEQSKINREILNGSSLKENIQSFKRNSIQANTVRVGNGGDGLFIASAPQSTSNAASPNPPHPAEKGVLRYSELERLWLNGQKTNASILTGKWMLVAQAATDECAKVTSTPDAYDKDGIKYEDGKKDGLIFNYEAADSFLPTNNMNFVVRRSALQGKDMLNTPYQVDPNEPQFAFWGSDDQDYYFSYSCRLVNRNSDRLVCAVKPTIIDHLIGRAQDCAAEPHGIMHGYVKVQN